MSKEEIALRMLQGSLALVFANEDRQLEAITCALSFADFFLDVAGDKKDE